MDFLQAIDLSVMRTITKKIVYTDFVVFRFLAAFFYKPILIHHHLVYNRVILINRTTVTD